MTALRERPALTAGTGFALFVSAIGSTQIALLVAGAATAVLAALRHWHGVLMVVLSVVAAQLIVQVIKHVVERPRPDAEDRSYTPADSASPAVTRPRAWRCTRPSRSS